ncbi:hypothetical protein Scep_006693 [Stephania cephalantha]|uniref:Protein LOW PSII ACCUMULATION 2, chloroplastic n=1 Tax=Stephania cephalantha TaxID=152367 RepID=A0AAP0K8F8_9MAGN
MALPIQSPHFLHKSPSPHHQFHLISSTKTRITIRATKQPQPEQPTPSNPQPQNSSSTLITQSDNKPSTNNPGLGFGSSSTTSPPPRQSRDSNKKKQRGRDRASVIRRTPVEKPTFVTQQEQSETQEQSRNENAFLLTWLGLGILILVEGIALAASGFLPEQWDNFFVKYLYPSFTPTVFVFVAGTVVYGVVKYLRGEKGKS